MSVVRVQTAAAGLDAALGAAPAPGNLSLAWANSDATVSIGPGWTARPSVIDGRGV